MDDVRAVMDAVGAERAVVVGVSRGRPDVHAVRRHAPGPHAGADHARRLRAPQLGAGLPDRPPRGAGRLAAPDGRAVGPLRDRAVPAGARAVDRRRRGRDRLVHVLPRPRRVARGRGGDHRHERGDRRPPRARLGARARRSSSTAPRSTCARRAATWARGCRARTWSRRRAPTTCRGRATRARCWTRSSSSSPACATRTPSRTSILTTVLEADVPESEHGLARSALARFRGQPLDAPHGRMRASFDGPARAVRCASALAESLPQLRAGVHTGECELRDGRLAGPALEIAAGVARAAAPGEILATSTVAGPRRRQRDRVLRARRGRAAARGRLARVAPVHRGTLTTTERLPGAYTGAQPSSR